MERLARQLAKKARHRYHHAVIVTRGGAIVAMGYNFGTTHAEIHALSRLWPSERRGCKVWSFRVTPGGKLAAAAPCGPCEAFLRESGIKVVWYSNSEGKMVRMKLR